VKLLDLVVRGKDVLARELDRAVFLVVITIARRRS
jgi:hypothetical protein